MERAADLATRDLIAAYYRRLLQGEGRAAALHDPVTHKVLDLRTQPIGNQAITELRERIAIGTSTGSVPPKRGDIILSISSRGSR